jgi:hypothetical protein
MNPNSGIPFIRLELEGMKQSIIHAFGELQVNQDQMVRDAVAKFCTTENLQGMLDSIVRETLTYEIKQAVTDFYRYREGRDLIKKLVQERLAESSTELG